MSGGKLGAGDPCPLCGGRSGVSAGDDGYTCLVCGGPRVLVDPPVDRAGGEKPFLERAKELRTRRGSWGFVGGVGTAAFAAAMAGSGLLSLFVDYGPVSGAVAGAALLGSLTVATLGWGKVRTTSGAIREALGRAELTVTEELLRARGALGADELARLLRVSTERAEELLAQAHVERFLEGGEPVPRLRVEAAPGATTGDAVLSGEPEGTVANRHRRV